ncbi:MAG: hypothetical protein CVV48_12050 [Spirochaetae bacterium HGW-Spirochaetae-4]|nr:MAG: hypothetical protein CVV48_12050 [Spirochaetae bacterium HGW-Spirochaetae-4]
MVRLARLCSTASFGSMDNRGNSRMVGISNTIGLMFPPIVLPMRHIMHQIVGMMAYDVKECHMKNIKRTHIYTLSRLVFLTLFIFLVSTGQFQLWLLVYIGGVLVSPILGRVYCGYACPMNTVMRPVEKISRKLGVQRQRLPRWLVNPHLRYVMLVAIVATMALGRGVLGKEIPILPILFVLSVAVTFFMKASIWHNSLCPYSLLLGLGGRFARYSRTVEESSCARTNRCVKVCPVGAVTLSGNEGKARIDAAKCLQCEDCTDICPKSAISYVKKK